MHEQIKATQTDPEINGKNTFRKHYKNTFQN